MSENKFSNMLNTHQFIIEKGILINRPLFLNFAITFVITFYVMSIQNFWDGLNPSSTNPTK